MRRIIVIAHNLRSCHNVGSLLRTAEGLGVEKMYLSGYTPYPLFSGDIRLPHLAHKIAAQISKTSLGAELSLAWETADDINTLLNELQQDGWQIAAIEQTSSSVTLNTFEPSDKTAIILGREVEGIEQEILQTCDITLEIPMFGKKESFNVVQAAAMALYHIRFK